MIFEILIVIANGFFTMLNKMFPIGNFAWVTEFHTFTDQLTGMYQNFSFPFYYVMQGTAWFWLTIIISILVLEQVIDVLSFMIRKTPLKHIFEF